jgi:hypothetical protein
LRVETRPEETRLVRFVTTSAPMSGSAVQLKRNVKECAAIPKELEFDQELFLMPL